MVKIPANVKKEDWAYAAGIMDSDGCFTLSKRKQSDYKSGIHYEAMVKVGQKDSEVCEWLKKTFGGSHGSYWAKNIYKPGEVHQWLMAARKCGRFIKGILPYLKLKRKQAELLLVFRETLNHNGQKVSEKIQSHREQLYLKMRALNGGGK